MWNRLRKLASDYKKCKRDWARTNNVTDPDLRRADRARVTSFRNSVRAALLREIKRVEGGLGRANRV